MMMKKNKRKLLYITIIAIVTLLIFLIGGNNESQRFDSEEWKNWKETETTLSLRWDMLKSLKNSYKIKGMSKGEVIELLGEPNTKSKNRFYYYLGYSKPGINTGNLILKFDENGFVISYEVEKG